MSGDEEVQNMSAIKVPGSVEDQLTDRQGEALLRFIEKSVYVNRRYQFFVWTQSYLQTLLPHKMLVCGAYQRPYKDVVYEALHSVPIAQSVLSVMTNGSSAFTQQMVGMWLNNRCRAVKINLASMAGHAAGADRDQILDAGFTDVLVHGVSRPQRPADIETLFMFSSDKAASSTEHCLHLNLLMPHLHATYQRVVAIEREMAGSVGAPAVLPLNSSKARALITERERQILSWVREGKSNQEIGEVLCISGLTVKNHVQKILRKLDASNRAQAVAKAMALNLLVTPTGGAHAVDMPHADAA